MAIDNEIMSSSLSQTDFTRVFVFPICVGVVSLLIELLLNGSFFVVDDDDIDNDDERLRFKLRTIRGLINSHLYL